MDIKLIDFNMRVSPEYRLQCFEALLNNLEDPELSFENLSGKQCSWHRLEFADKTIIRYTIVKNKTCYTVYFSEEKSK